MDKKVPDIRFRGFDEDWATSTLDNYITVSNEKNCSDLYNKYDIYSVSREYGVVNQIEYQGKSFAGASLTGYHVVQQGDVVYTKSPLKTEPYGIIKTNKGVNGIVSALYGVFHPTVSVDTSFVQVYFELDSRLNSYLRPLVNKGAKNTLLISDEDAIQGEVTFPKKDEQQKIVALFTAIDKLIRQLEAKLEKLRRIKQSLLRQMFTNVNRGGGYAIAPQIRFVGFNEPWNMTTLGNIAQKVTEKNTKREYSTVLTNSAEYGIVAQSEFFDKEIANTNNINGYYIVKPDMFVYNPRISVTAPVGPINRNKLGKSGVMSPLYYVFSVKGIGLGFLEYTFKGTGWHNFMFENGNSGARSDRFSINDEVFSKLPIPFPQTKEEQERIAELFILLDNDLKSEHSRLFKLRTMKQSLLQKMFV